MKKIDGRGRPKMTEEEKQLAKNKRDGGRKTPEAPSMQAAIDRKDSTVDLGQLLQIVTNLASTALKLCKDYHELSRAILRPETLYQIMTPVPVNPEYVAGNALPEAIEEVKYETTQRSSYNIAKQALEVNDTLQLEKPKKGRKKKESIGVAVVEEALDGPVAEVNGDEVEETVKPKAVVKRKAKAPTVEKDSFGSIPESNLDDILR